MTTKARDLAGYLPDYWVSMTDATQYLWGSSGRGNPNAVKKIEAIAYFGAAEIRQVTKTRREVRRAPGVPPVEGFHDWKLES